jgi:hypothetical protein
MLDAVARAKPSRRNRARGSATRPVLAQLVGLAVSYDCPPGREAGRGAAALATPDAEQSAAARRLGLQVRWSGGSGRWALVGWNRGSESCTARTSNPLDGPWIGQPLSTGPGTDSGPVAQSHEDSVPAMPALLAVFVCNTFGGCLSARP